MELHEGHYELLDLWSKSGDDREPARRALQEKWKDQHPQWWLAMAQWLEEKGLGQFSRRLGSANVPPGDLTKQGRDCLAARPSPG